MRITLIFLTFLIVGCAASTPLPTATAALTNTPVQSLSPTFTTSPIPATFTATPSLPEPTEIPILAICSPLEGITIHDLPDTIVNPFAPPRLGSDDPHQGIDFADIDPSYQIALEGRTVNAVIGGVVAGVINNRFPYGNAILVETPLDRLPVEWLVAIQIPTPAPIRDGHPSLTCPETALTLESMSGTRSIYLIYAHLQKTPTLQIGDSITCGTPIGAIGNSGNSLNPHVHLEMRVGPSNVRFDSIAHYTGSATPDELANYCLWRVSEAFQLLDPMRLFSPAQ
jgi:murein DD-endopeptidase MepM/ murein hydrolase activator NlpD